MLLEPITTNTAALKSSIKLGVLKVIAGWWRRQTGQVAVGGVPAIHKNVLINFISGFNLRVWRWHIILMAWFFLSSLQVGAWQKKQDLVKYDSSLLQIRSLPDSNIKVYTADEEFNYSVQRSKSESIWDRLWYWVYRNIAKMQANKFWGRFFEVFLWIFCIGAFVYAGFKLTGMNSTALFSGDKKNEQLDYNLEEDNIYAINFSEAIQVAINERNFRLATRLLYLQSLRKLADAELISWRINKTNDVYLHELASSSYHESFGFLTKAYEYAWYGEMAIDEALFKNINQQFIIFNSGISV